MLELMDHQRSIVELCLSQRATLVAAGIGTGKTLVGIECLDPAKKCLVICPASLQQNWKKEILTWRPTWEILEANPSKPPEPGIYVCSYNALKNIWAWKWDIVVCDEAHLCKNPAATRTQLCADILEQAERIVLMTATPALNNVGETKQLMNLLGYPHTPDDPIKLHNYMIDNNLMVRVKTSDVIDLPTPKFSRMNIGLSSVDQIRQLTEDLREMYLASDSDTTKMWNDYRPQLVGKLSAIRKHVGIAKLRDAATQINEHLKTGQNLIVFAHHRHVIEALGDTFDAPILYGSTSLKKRHKIVEEFQEGKHKVIICSIQAAGVGLTLTASHHVMFVEFPWTSSEYDQAYGRSHRKTQEKQVNVIDLVSDHQLDVRHLELLHDKRQVCDSITDGNPSESLSMIQRSLIQSIIEAA